jgi:hypothetical protein
LDEIVAMLDNASPRKVALILDCCFGGAIATSFPSLKQIKDFWVVTAAGQDESAYEKEGSTHSILTGYLLDGLASGVADLDGSGYVSIAEAILYAQRLINALFAGQNLNQEPVLFLPTGARGELILGVAPARPERDHDRILKEDLDVFTVMSGIADLVSSGAPMQFRVMLQYYEIEGMSVRATMLTVSPDYTPNMRVHEDAVECDAFFAPDRLPDDFVAQRQVVDGKVRVRMRLPFWGIYMVIGTRDADLAKGDTDAVRLLERSPREAS